MGSKSAPSADVLWSLTNHTVAAGDYIDTGIAPFVAGLSTTILLDYDQQDYTSTQGNYGSIIKYLFVSTSGTSMFAIGKYGRVGKGIYYWWMGVAATMIANVSSVIGRKRIAVLHEANSDDITIYIKTGDAVKTITVSDTFVASNRPLKIGGDATTGSLLDGTITNAKIYNRILSAAEISAFFA